MPRRGGLPRSPWSPRRKPSRPIAPASPSATSITSRRSPRRCANTKPASPPATRAIIARPRSRRSTMRMTTSTRRSRKSKSSAPRNSERVMSRIGIAFSGGPSPAEIVGLVELAEALGYESAWVAEGHGGDQFAILAACAAQTSRIGLGTAISSVFVRTVPTIAMAAAAVDDISGGRFILGLGSSHKVQVEGEHGVVYAKPLTRVRESVAAIRDLLRDGRTRHIGETVRIEGFDLWFAPRRPEQPIYVSAVFQKGIALCGEIADGIILTRSTLRTGAEVRRHLAEGAARAGRDPSRISVTSLL